jgi:hypothetical protein
MEVDLGATATDSAKVSLAGSLPRGKAVAIFNQTESGQDIITASAAGTPRMTLTNAGNLQFHQASSITTTTGNLTLSPTGNLVLDSTGGTIEIRDAIINSSFQATDLQIRDNVANAFSITQGGNTYLSITTTDDQESLTLNLPTGGGTSQTANLFTSSIAKTINLGTGTAADIINIGTGGTTADDINIGGLATTTIDIFGVTTLGNPGASTYAQFASSGNLSFANASGSTITGPGSGGLTLTNASGNILINTTSSGNVTIGPTIASGATNDLYFQDGNITAALPLSITSTSLDTPTKAIVDAINEAWGAAVGGGSGLWGTSNNAIYPNVATRRVGIGTNSSANINQSLYVTNASSAPDQALVVFNQTDSTADIFIASKSGSPVFKLTNTGNVRVGTNVPDTGKLNVEGSFVGKALAIFNETGDQNILTASSSGTTVMTMGRDGNLTLYSSASSNYDALRIQPNQTGSGRLTGTITSADITDTNKTWTLPNLDGVVCLDTGNCEGTAGGSKWTDDTSTIYLTETGRDLVIGGNSPLSDAKLSLDGDEDEIQFIVQGHSTQTSDLVVFESSDGTDRFTLSNAGLLSTGNLTLGLNSTGGTISTADTNENLTIDPNGTGSVFFHGSTYEITSTGLLTIGNRITLGNSEYIDNATNGSLIFGDSGGQSITFDLDATHPTIESSTDTVIINDNLTITTGTTIGATSVTALNLGAATIDFNGAGLLRFNDNANFTIADDATRNIFFYNGSTNAVQFGNATDNNAFTFLGTGSVTTGGVLNVSGATIGINNDEYQYNLLATGSGAGDAAGQDLYWGNKLICDASEDDCGWATVGGTGESKWSEQNNLLYPSNATTLSVAIGTTTESAMHGLFTVSGTRIGRALAVLNDTGTDQNILTASASGTTVFNLNRSGNLQVATGQGVDTLTAGELKLGDTTATTVSIGGGAATTINLGNSGSLTRTINIGTGTGVDTINIGTGATGADLITIGSANAGDLVITSGAALEITGGANSAIDFTNFDVSTAGVITLQGGQAADITTQGNNNLNISAGGTGDIRLLTDADSVLHIATLSSGTGSALCIDASNNVVTCTTGTGGVSGSGTAGQIAFFDTATSISSETTGFKWDAAAKKLGLGTDSPTAALHVTGNATNNAVAIFDQTGSADILTASASGATRFTLSNTGDVSLISGTANADVFKLTPNATGANSYTGTLSMLDLTENRAWNLPDQGGTIALLTDISGSNLWQEADQGLAPYNLTLDTYFGGTATASAHARIAGIETTGGNLLQLSSDATTTGSVFNLDASALTTGWALDIQSTSTALTTGGLGLFDWSPTSWATASGDLVKINIGQYGDITGSLFAVYDNSTPLFTVGTTQIESAVPHAFTAAGDVSFSYDINMTNQTASQIRSQGPFSIVVGDSYESNPLTLKTYGTGDFIFDNDGSSIALLSDEGKLVLGSSTPVGMLTVDNSTTNAINKALVVLNQDESENIITASASGTTVFNLTSAGNIELKGTAATTDSLIIQPNTSGSNSFTGTLTTADITGENKTWTLPNTSGIIALTSDIVAGSNYWQVGDEGLAPYNETLDLFVGGTATGTAKFAVEALTGNVKVDGDIDMATGNWIGLGSGAGRFVFTDASPDTITVTDADLNLGTNALTGTTASIDFTNFDVSTAGVITLQGGQAADITTQGNNNLNISAGGTGDIRLLTDGDSVLHIATLSSGTGSALCIDASNNVVTCTTGTGGVSGSGTAGQIAFFDTATSISSETTGFKWDADAKKLGLGTDSPTAALHVTGNATNNAVAIFNQTGSADILTASASGATRFTLSNTGDVSLISGTANADVFKLTPNATGANSYTGTLSMLDLSENRTWNLPNQGGTIALTSDITSGENFWQENAGVLSPYSTSLDLAIGGTSTSAAKFIAFGTETAAGGVGAITSTVTTTGNVFGITGSALTTGNLLNLSSTSTALTSGRLLNLDWSPTSWATSSGDLVRINIGQYGDVTGNLFNVTDNGSSLFRVSTNQIESAAPHVFSAAGDTSFAYDIIMANQTSSNIKSYGPLTIEAGESFESNDLQLKAYNSGDIVLNTGASGNVTLMNNGTALDCTVNSNGGALTTDSSGNIVCSDDDGGSGGTSYWTMSGGYIYPNEPHYSLVVGATATESAKFHVDATTGNIKVAAGQGLDTLSAGTLNIGSSTANAINIGNTGSSTNITLGVGTSGNIILQRNGSAINCSGYDNGGALTTDASGNLICSNDDGGTGGTNYWQLGTQGLAPYNLSLDLFVGGTATAGATFAVEAATGNVLTDGDVTISGNELYFGNGEYISNAANGNLVFQGVGGDATDLTLDLDGTYPVFSSATDIRIGVTEFLNVQVAGVTNAAAGDIWYDSSANKFKINEAGTTKTLCNTTDLGCGDAGTNYWQLGTQGLAPYNLSLDLFVGGTATAGATFAVEAATGNVLTDGDVTISGNELYFGNGEYISNAANGNLVFQGVGGDATDLTLDLDGTYPVFSSATDIRIGVTEFLNVQVAGVTNAAAGDIWYDSSANKFKINEAGTTKTLCNTTDLGCGDAGTNYWQLGTQGLAPYNLSLDLFVGGTATAGATFAVEAATGNVLTDGDVTISGNELYFGNGEYISNAANGNLVFQGVGGDATDLTLDLDGTYPVFSSATDIRIGVTEFLNVQVAGVTNAAAGDIWYDSSANKFKINEAGTTKTLCNTTDLGCGDAGTNYWQLGTQGLAPYNLSLDLFVGGTATAGATFAVEANTGNVKMSGTTLSAANLTTIDAASGLSIDSETLTLGGGAAATIGTLSNVNLTIAPNGTGNLILDPTGAGDILIGSADVTSITLDALALSLDATTTSNFTVTGSGQSLTLSASGGGAQSLNLSSAGTGTDAVNIDATAGGIDIDAAGAIDILAGGAFSIDGTGASNVSATEGNLTLSTITSGNVVINAAQALDIDAAGAITINNSGAGNDITISSIDDLVFDAADSSSVFFSDYANCTYLYTGGSGVLTCGTAELATSDDIYWSQNDSLGILYPKNETVDVLIGATATTSAEFAFTGLAGSSPKMVFANDIELFRSGAGALDTSATTFTLGGGSAATITTSGTAGLTLDTASTGTLNLGTGNDAKTINLGTGTAANAINIGTDNTAGDTLVIGNNNAATLLTLTGGDDWNITSGGVGTLKSLNLTDNTNQIVLGTTTLGTLTMDSLSEARSWMLPDKSGTIALTTDIETNYWQLTADNKGLLPYNSSLDIMVGANATSSAKLVAKALETASGNILDINSTGITTGNVVDINSTSITSGKLLSLSATNNTLTTGTGLDINLSSTTTTAGTRYGSKITLTNTGNVTTGSDHTYGQYIGVTRTVAVTTGLNTYGQYIDTLGGSNSSQSIYGTTNKLTSYASANTVANNNLLYLYGNHTTVNQIQSVSYLSENTNIVNHKGLSTYVTLVEGTSNITTAQGIYIEAPDGDGLIQNNYGLYVTDHSNMGDSHSYNIYSSGTTAKNYFQGLVGIGDLTPDANLEVLSTTEQLRLSHTDNTADARFTVDSNGYLTINTTGNRVIMGTDDQLVLGNMASDPGTSQLGAMYYNTTTNKYKCYTNTGWTDCDTTGTSGGDNYWQENAGVLSPYSSSLDLAVGGTSTSAAKFIAYGTETATGGVGKIASTTTTTGNVFSMSASALTSGNLLDLTSSSTALTSGRLLNLDWSPTSWATASGDLVRINIGQYGDITGNLFNITDNTSSLFKVSTSKITSALPHEFTAAGDVSLAYDLIFTNQTAGMIESYGPFTLRVGESFESNNLNFETYGAGDIIFATASANAKVRINSEGSMAIGNSTAVDSSNVPHGSLVVENGIVCVDNGTGNNCATTARTAGYVYAENSSLGGLDVAEVYPSNQNLSAGEIVAVDRQNNYFVSRSSSAYEPGLIGIVSTKPGITLGGFGYDRYPQEILFPIALTGRVPVNISDNSEAITKGDYITSSNVAGKAMKATKTGRIIGQALEDWAPNSGKDQLMVFINNTFYMPDNTLTGTGDVKFAQDTQNAGYVKLEDSDGNLISKLSGITGLIAENIRSGAIQTNQLISDQIVSRITRTREIKPLEGEQDIAIQLGNTNTQGTSGTSGFGKLIIRDRSGDTSVEIDEAGNATFKGKLTADSLQANDVQTGAVTAENATIAGELRVGKIYADSIDGAITREDIEALLAEYELNQELLSQTSDWETNTSTGTGTFDGGVLTATDIYATGTAVFNSLSVAETIVLGSDLVFSSQLNPQTGQPSNSINTLESPLQIQSAGAQAIHMMAGLVKIDTFGNVDIAGSLNVAGKVGASGLTLSATDDQQDELSGFGKLISLINNEGQEVAMVSASGAAEFASITTEVLVLKDDPAATSSATLMGYTYESSATAGTARVPQGAKDVIIRNPNIKEGSLVFVTPTSSTMNVLYIKEQTEGQIIVGFDIPANKEVTFNWWLVELQNNTSTTP